MDTYRVTGMSCAACSARVEKAVAAVEGVSSCNVNLLLNTLTVDGTAAENDIIRAVEAAGYGASRNGAVEKSEKKEEFVDTETPKLKRRLVTSLVFLAVLMTLSMGHMVGLTMPGWMNPMAQGLTQLLLTTVVLILNGRFFVNGFSSLIKKSPNMDTLVALGSGAAYVYSIAVLYGMTAGVGVL